MTLSTSKQIIDGAMHFLFLIFLTYVFVFTTNNPIITWDIAAYVASVISLEEGTAVQVHSQTYELLRTSLDPSQYQSVIAGPYGSNMLDNAQNFNSQLDMYKVKPLYILTLSMVGMFGLNEIESIFLVSSVSAILLISLMYYWLCHYTSSVKSLTISVLFFVGARLFDLARVGTPDMLSSLIVFSAMFLLIHRQMLVPACLLLILSIATRTNNIIFVSSFFTIILITEFVKTQRFLTLRFTVFSISLMVSSFVYLVVSTLFDQNWWTLFYHTFIANIYNISSFNIPFSLTSYIAVLESSIVQIYATGTFTYTTLPLFLLLLLTGLLGVNTWRTCGGQWRAVLLATLVNFLAFLFLFPLVSTWDRFFTPYFALIVVFLVYAMKKQELHPKNQIK